MTQPPDDPFNARNVDGASSRRGALRDQGPKVRICLLVHVEAYDRPGYNGFANWQIEALTDILTSPWHRHGDTFRGHHPPQSHLLGPYWTRPRYECPGCRQWVWGEIDPDDAHMDGHSRPQRPLLPLLPVNRPLDVNPCPTCGHNLTADDMIERRNPVTGMGQRVLWITEKGLRAGHLWSNPRLNAARVWLMSEEVETLEEALEPPVPPPSPPATDWVQEKLRGYLDRRNQ